MSFDIATANSEEERQILANMGIYLQVEGALTLLIMAATAGNNRTEISCIEHISFPPVISAAVQLTVTGRVFWLSHKFCFMVTLFVV